MQTTCVEMQTTCLTSRPTILRSACNRRCLVKLQNLLDVVVTSLHIFSNPGGAQVPVPDQQALFAAITQTSCFDVCKLTI